MTEEFMNTNEEMETYSNEESSDYSDIPSTDSESDIVWVDEKQDSNAGKIALAIIGGAIALGGVVIAKNKNKINAWRDKRAIKRLAKKGYVVTEMDVEESDNDDVETIDAENIHVVE